MNMSDFEERPLVEHDQDFHEYEQVGGAWWGCFRVFDYRRWRQQHRDDDEDGGGGGGGGGGWLMSKLRMMKEASEVIAGPKWKTFIRKMNCRNKQKNNRFQYDERSYALNFDSFVLNNEDEDLDFPPSFSSRFTDPIRHTES